MLAGPADASSGSSALVLLELMPGPQDSASASTTRPGLWAGCGTLAPLWGGFMGTPAASAGVVLSVSVVPGCAGRELAGVWSSPVAGVSCGGGCRIASSGDTAAVARAVLRAFSAAAASSSACFAAAATSRAARAALTDRSASARSSRSLACFTRINSPTSAPGLSTITASSAARNTFGGSSMSRSTSRSITTGSPTVATTARLSAACCRISELPSARHPRIVLTALSQPR
mmetsp:Transcript_51954/g.137438  ORF Transcript_51954/g.137438 Transcript_51954/m.137438 type:complete len:231 (-) Transcript_51954:2145-2837(-)